MNVAQARHLTDSQLQAFAQGELDDAAFSEAEQHLDHCDQCCQRLANQPENTLLALARQVGTVGGLGSMRLDQSTDTLPVDLVDHPRYRVLEAIGVGGMGAVYKAEHRLMQRLVALKLVHPWLLSNPHAVERFEREVRLAARLTHPNIVVAYDADQTAQRHFLVMEYVHGQTLYDKIRRDGVAEIQQACDWIAQAADGLEHAHQQGMTHRDIKPQNLMITPDGRLRILDFGLSRLATDAHAAWDEVSVAARRSRESALPTYEPSGGAQDTRCCPIARTDSSMILGTPDYIAPEQIDSSASVDTRADIYSLGCTLYYLLTGRAPFHAANLSTILDGHLHGSFPDVRQSRADVPAELASLLSQMTARRPEDRYSTPADVASAIKELLNRWEHPAATTGPMDQTQLQPSSSKRPDYQAAYSTTKSAGFKPTHRRWSRRAWLGVGMSALSAGAILLWAYPSRPARLLVMLPSEGLWFPDYEQLQEASVRLAGKVQLVFASPQPRPANLLPQSKPGVAVPDLLLDSQLQADQYDALIFIGYQTDEFSPEGIAGIDVARLVNQFQMQKKVLGGLCAGQRLLAQHHALRGKQVTTCQSVSDEEIEVEGGTRVNTTVKMDGLIVTATSADYAEDFLQNILQALQR